VLIALTVLALGIRLYRLDARDFWEDEQVTLVDSQGVLSTLEAGAGEVFPSTRLHSGAGLLAITEYSSGHDQPIYVGWMHLWTRLVRPTEWTLRLPSALTGAATVPLLGILGAQLLGRRQGFWAALLLAVAPLHVSYSQEARTYAATVFLVVLSTVACLAVAESADRRAWTAYGAVAAMLPAMHLLATVALLPQAAWLLGRPLARRRLAYAAASGLLVLCLLTPFGWLQSVVAAHEESGLALRHPPPELRAWALPISVSTFTSGLGATTTRLLGIEYGRWGLRARDVIWLSGPLLAAVCMAAWRTRPRRAGLFLAAEAFLPLSTAACLSLVYGHVVPFQERYSAWSMPFLALLFAEGIVQLKGRLVSRSAGAAIVLIWGIFLARMQLSPVSRTTPRADEVGKLAACLPTGDVLRANDPTEAAVIAAWTKQPLLLQVGGGGPASPRTAWEVEPVNGTICATSPVPACGDSWPPCPPPR
jgi:4-amino-4-deoxy-L-arabinose transferase-like glycosyltransferase